MVTYTLVILQLFESFHFGFQAVPRVAPLLAVVTNVLDTKLCLICHTQWNWLHDW